MPPVLALLMGCCLQLAPVLPDSQPQPTLWQILREDTHRHTPPDTLPLHELALLQEGDILLRRGYGAISQSIITLLNEPEQLTHCGIVLTQGYRQPHILHTISSPQHNGVVIEPWQRFVRESQQASLVAVRPRGTEAQRARLVQEAKYLWQRKTPFDMAFDERDSSALYCAELLQVVLQRAYGEDLLPDRLELAERRGIRMRNFLAPRYFVVLFSHLPRD